MRVSSRRVVALAAACASVGVALGSSEALACGCFTPPDPSVPVVQAGERILFAVNNGTVTSHVQIQYAGEAKEFGWLLPLPAIPTLELGTDELFTQLYATTQPKYRLTTTFESTCPQSQGRGFGAPTANAGFSAEDSKAGPPGEPSPLVVQDSIGPYDYAVLKADSKVAMLDWLNTNHYFVPAGTDDAVNPYIHEGAFFLALKLQSGKSAGDLQPVVLHYASDVGMIPILLTATGAKENMGVQVWMLGPGRAIPRNYNHTVINDATINWVSSGANYNDVIIRAASEAPGKHTFVTEFAGASTVMHNVLATPERFGTKEELAAQPTVDAFMTYLVSHQYPTQTPGSFGLPVWSSPLKAILSKYVPVPASFATKMISADQFYGNFSFFSTSSSFAADRIGWSVNYQPQQMAEEIFSRVVEPTRAASALFDAQPYLTRMYTTLSPADMNKDPVFSFNRSLPDVSNVHEGKMTVSCSVFGGRELSAVMTTEQGWHINFPQGRFSAPAIDTSFMPASLRIESLREEGAPETSVDNQATISKTFAAAKACGCQSTEVGAVLFALLPLWAARRRSSRKP